MNRCARPCLFLGLSLWLCPSALANDQTPLAPDDPFYGLLVDDRPWQVRAETDFVSQISFGVGAVSDDNRQFGRYRGLSDSGIVGLADLQWRSWQSDQFWQVNLAQDGGANREGQVRLLLANGAKLSLSVNSQQQSHSLWGQTPFIGRTDLRLPANWVGAANNPDFSALPSSVRPLNHGLTREHYSLTVAAPLRGAWSMDAELSVAYKHGYQVRGAAIYSDAANPQAVQLPEPVDYQTREFSTGLHYAGFAFNASAQYRITDFDNADSQLQWQNPYASGLGPEVDYPSGTGAVALAPDNRHHQLRLTSQGLISPRLRWQLDASVGRSSQQQNFLPYTVNPALQVFEALPREHLDGRRDSMMVSGRLQGQATAGLQWALRYRLDGRENQSPRDGYRYVRGDATDQPAAAFTAYNTGHDYQSQTVGLESNYRVRARHKIDLEVEQEVVSRRNAAVQTSREHRLELGYRTRPWTGLNSRLSIGLADRAASEYQWDQSYFALYDVALINATPDDQRYLNHPLLSQFHLANREQQQLKWDVSYSPTTSWQLSLNSVWRHDDYDATELGLTDAELRRWQFNGSYHWAEQSTVSAYVGVDWLRTEQRGRAFRGGQEKPAWVVEPPLPQASDPARDWHIGWHNRVVNAGVDARWRLDYRTQVMAQLQWQTSASKQDVSSADVPSAAALPDQLSRLQKFTLSGEYYLSPEWLLTPSYRFYRYRLRDWADESQILNKVLTLGYRSPDETVHYISLTATLRW